MKRVAIIGGETHIGEITLLVGQQLEIGGVVVREDQREQAATDFKVPIFADEATLYAQARPEIVAVANENDQKARVVLRALEEGCDVVVDKPLALTLTNPTGAEIAITELPEARSVVADWIEGGELVDQASSLRANRLSIQATISAEERRKIEL